jgi:hypothetical protein
VVIRVHDVDVVVGVDGNPARAVQLTLAIAEVPPLGEEVAVRVGDLDAVVVGVPMNCPCPLPREPSLIMNSPSGSNFWTRRL